MADVRRLKNGLLLYINRCSSDFDEIWFADANFDSENGRLTKI